MGYKDITSRSAVLGAIREYDRLGKDKFLATYGYQNSRGFFLKFKGKEYASKAIIGVAHKHQFGTALRWDGFSGGRSTVQPLLEGLGFEVVVRQAVTKGLRAAPKAELDDSWSAAELRAAVESYVDMQRLWRAGQKVAKKPYYIALAKRFGRTSKAFEFRMQNISYVLALMGREFLPGLKPAKNIGSKNALIVERMIQEAEGRVVESLISFELAAQAAKKSKKKPQGNTQPKTKQTSTTQYVRDAAVKAWVIANAKGKCECCLKAAPFESVFGPFLEVHHVHRLCDGGADTVENALALCPNCHRMLHYSLGANEIIEKMYVKHCRLVRALPAP